MSPQPPHLGQDRSTIIPPRIQVEMAKHMENTLPANLQYYQKSGAYVPPNVQKQMAQHMEQSMPEHLKQYINPYMQQQVVPQHLASTPPGGQPAHFNPITPTPPSYAPNQVLPRPPEAQPWSTTPQPQQISPSQTVQPTVQPQASVQPQEPYAFITNPEIPAVAAPTLLSNLKGRSLAMRTIIVGGGFIALIIVYSILKGLLIAGFDLPPYLAIVQDQQELIYLTSGPSKYQPNQADLPAGYQNFIATTHATITSSQTQLLTYLTESKQKINPKLVNLRVSAAVNNELLNSVTSNTYQATFQQVMARELNIYTADLSAAYNKSPTITSHVLLSRDFKQAQLLTKQLNGGNSSSGG
jgi:hypothetical protein